MNLVGTLRGVSVGGDSGEAEEMNLINVGVSLAEGLELWKKDAGLGEFVVSFSGGSRTESYGGFFFSLGSFG